MVNRLTLNWTIGKQRTNDAYSYRLLWIAHVLQNNVVPFGVDDTCRVEGFAIQIFEDLHQHLVWQRLEWAFGFCRIDYFAGRLNVFWRERVCTWTSKWAASHSGAVWTILLGWDPNYNWYTIKLIEKGLTFHSCFEFSRTFSRGLSCNSAIWNNALNQLERRQSAKAVNNVDGL